MANSDIRMLPSNLECNVFVQSEIKLDKSLRWNILATVFMHKVVRSNILTKAYKGVITYYII